MKHNFLLLLPLRFMTVNILISYWQINNNTGTAAAEIPPQPVTSEPANQSNPTTTLDKDSEHRGESDALAASDNITSTDIDSSCKGPADDTTEIVHKNSTSEIGNKETASAEKKIELTKDLNTAPSVHLEKSSSPTTAINQPSDAGAEQIKTAKLDKSEEMSPTNPKSETTKDANVKEESDCLKAESPVVTVSPVKDGEAMTAKASDNPGEGSTPLSKPAAVAGSPTPELTTPESPSASASAQSPSSKISAVAVPTPETAVTNCTSIVNDIVTNSMNSSKWLIVKKFEVLSYCTLCTLYYTNQSRAEYAVSYYRIFRTRLVLSYIKTS